MIFRRDLLVILAVLGFGMASHLRAETTTTVVNESEACLAKGLEIYHKSNLPALYEDHFTVIEPWAGMERTFDFFTRVWTAELKPKKHWAYPVSIYFKFRLSTTDEILSGPSIEDLNELVNEAFRHPWIRHHLESGDAKASLDLRIRQELNGQRDRFGLGFYLRHLGIEKTELNEESKWEHFGLNITSQYFDLWLNNQTGSLVYREPYRQSEDQDRSQITMHWVDVQGKVQKTHVVDRDNSPRP